MKILYLGFLVPGGTSTDRATTLSDLGHDVFTYNMASRIPGTGRIEASMLGRYHFGPRMKLLNQDVRELVHANDFDIVFVDKGIWLFPDVLEQAKAKSTRKFAVHYTPDAQILDNRSRHYLRAIPTYDLHVTTKTFELEPLQRLGAKNVLLTYQGYGSQFFASVPPAPVAELQSDVCFVGHSQRHYRRTIKAITTENIDLKIWGPKWPRWARVHGWLQPYVKGPGLWGENYPGALISSKIALGLLSKYIPETSTTRTFEIPATGTFMLAERSDEHLALFEESKEAEYFGSMDELKDKLAYYLSHDAERQAIAKAGRERCLSSSYSTKDILSKIMRECEALIG